MKRQIGIALVTALGLASSVLAEDITAAVRAANAATFGLTGGTEYDVNHPISRAFDGLWSADVYRAMISPDTENNYPPIAIYYHIDSSFRPDDAIIVTSFTMRRSNNAGDSPRMPLRMRLEASPTGDPAGDDWVVLTENTEDFPGGVEGHVPTEGVDMCFTVNVPRVSQRSYRHYRFVFPARHIFVNVFHELFLEGQITQGTVPERLTWNGGTATWDTTSKQWLDAAGEASVWKPFSRAVIGSSVTLADMQDVVSLQFGEISGPVVSGGMLRFGSQAGIGVEGFASVNADVCSADDCSRVGVDTDSTCVTGTRTTDYTFLPHDSSVSAGNVGLEVVWWKNRRLSDITGFDPAIIWYQGDGEGTSDKEKGVSGFANDGSQASAWFWRYYSGTGTHLAWVAAKVSFRQVGADITAKILKGGFAWLDGYDRTQGAQIDFEHVSVSSAAFHDDSTPGVQFSTGLRGIKAQCDSRSGLEVVNLRHWESKLGEGEKLSHDPENDKIGEKVLYATNLKLSKVSGFSSAMLWYNAVKEPAEPLRMAREDDALTVQFQRFYAGSNVLCVKVRFTQEGDDVYAQALYAKYLNSQTQLGADFDRSGAQQPIWHAGVNVGYTMSDMVPVVDRMVCSFGGAFAIRGPVMADGVDLTFGGAVSVRDAEMFAETPSALTDGASLAVADGVAATMPKLTVSGMVSLTCGEGASLALGEIELADGATVNLVGDLDAGAFRVGTSATLSRSVLKKFSVANKGLRVVQDEDGYLKTALPPGLMLLFR